MSRTVQAAFVVAMAATAGCASIGPGQVGVLWKASRRHADQALFGEGLHPVATWNEMYVYDLRSMSRDEVLSVIAVNGLTIQPRRVGALPPLARRSRRAARRGRPECFEKILEPVLRSEARRVFGQYTPGDVLDEARGHRARDSQRCASARIEGRHIALEAILIRDVELPTAIRMAIESEARRRAGGAEDEIRDSVGRRRPSRSRSKPKRSPTTTASSPPASSPAILEFERIQQMTQLAASTNAKTVLLGAGASAPLMINASPPAR